MQHSRVWPWVAVFEAFGSLLSFVCFAFRKGAFREFKDFWTVSSLQFWGFRDFGPCNSTGTVAEQPRAHLGCSGLRFGYRCGIALSNLGMPSNFQNFHPHNLDTLRVSPIVLPVTASICHLRPPPAFKIHRRSFGPHLKSLLPRPPGGSRK